MSRTGQVDDIRIGVILNEPVQVDVNKTESGRGPPVPKQTWFNMFGAQRLFEKRILL